jgi:hypothetical protein
MTGGPDRPYLIGAMFTAAYAEKAERLRSSCDRVGLSYAIHEVPAVHRSTNRRVGTADLAFTKPNFIRHLLATHGKPILYLDADCEIVSDPCLIDELARTDYDFAIYNWLADDYNDRFLPTEIRLAPNQPPTKARFFCFGGRVVLFDKYFTTKQLLCSGLVQFYGTSDRAQSLLMDWHRTIAAFPGTADDECLGFAFNNLGERSPALNVRWLPKSYARIYWWIYVEPIINHRDPVQQDTGYLLISDPAGRQSFYPSLADQRTLNLRFPRDCIIDTELGLLCRTEGNRLIPFSRTDQRFWVDE